MRRHSISVFTASFIEVAVKSKICDEAKTSAKKTDRTSDTGKTLAKGQKSEEVEGEDEEQYMSADEGASNATDDVSSFLLSHLSTKKYMKTWL